MLLAARLVHVAARRRRACGGAGGVGCWAYPVMSLIPRPRPRVHAVGRRSSRPLERRCCCSFGVHGPLASLRGSGTPVAQAPRVSPRCSGSGPGFGCAPTVNSGPRRGAAARSAPRLCPISLFSPSTGTGERRRHWRPWSSVPRLPPPRL